MAKEETEEEKTRSSRGGRNGDRSSRSGQHPEQPEGNSYNDPDVIKREELEMCDSQSPENEASEEPSFSRSAGMFSDSGNSQECGDEHSELVGTSVKKQCTAVVSHSEGMSTHTLPESLCIVQCSSSGRGQGVWTTEPLHKGQTFGPYNQEMIMGNRLKKTRCLTEGDDGGVVAAHVNWIDLVREAEEKGQENLITFCQGELVYSELTQEVPENTELILWRQEKDEGEGATVPNLPTLIDVSGTAKDQTQDCRSASVRPWTGSMKPSVGAEDRSENFPKDERDDHNSFGDESIESDPEQPATPDELSNIPHFGKRAKPCSHHGHEQYVQMGSDSQGYTISSIRHSKTSQVLRDRWSQVDTSIRMTPGFYGGYHIAPVRMGYLMSFQFENRGPSTILCPHCEYTSSIRKRLVRHVLHKHFPFVLMWLCNFKSKQGIRCPHRSRRISDLYTHAFIDHGILSQIVTLELHYDSYYNDQYVPPSNVGLNSPFEFASQVADDFGLLTASGSSSIPVVPASLRPEHTHCVPFARRGEDGQWPGNGSNSGAAGRGARAQSSTCSVSVGARSATQKEVRTQVQLNGYSKQKQQPTDLAPRDLSDQPNSDLAPPTKKTKHSGETPEARCHVPSLGYSAAQFEAAKTTIHESMTALDKAVTEATKFSRLTQLDDLTRSALAQVDVCTRFTARAVQMAQMAADTHRRVTLSTALVRQKAQIRKDIQAEHDKVVADLTADRDRIRRELDSLK